MILFEKVIIIDTLKAAKNSLFYNKNINFNLSISQKDLIKCGIFPFPYLPSTAV